MRMRDRIGVPENMLEEGQVRFQWLDFIKAIAIIAVLQNHLPAEAKLCNELYSIFSVSLFVLCGGIASVISLQSKSNFEYETYLKTKINKIFLPYFLATCAYTIYDKGYLDVFYTFNKLVTFSAGSNGHMYYLVFYFELIMVAPILVGLYMKFEKNEFMLGFILVLSMGMSFLFYKYTYLEKFVLGARFLFGGSYFFLFNLGIYFYFHINLFNKLFTKVISIIINLSLLRYIIYKEWCLTWWSNPPTMKVIIYTVVLFLLLYNSITLLQKIPIGTKLRTFMDFIINLFCWFGRESLHIYLWHMLVMDILLNNELFDKKVMGIGKKLVVTGIIMYIPCVMHALYKKGQRYRLDVGH